VRLHLPPDLRSGAVIRTEMLEPQNVYAFARYIFQQINYWPDSGVKDYGVAIYRMAAYLAPRFKDELKADLEQRAKRGELPDRIRAVQDVPGHGYEESRVTIHGNGAWTVMLDLHIDEHVRGMSVKSVSVRYPLRVIHYDVNPETNPWELALDGYDPPGPQRLEPDKPGQPVQEQRG
jgi:integrating conjugative element protein (TIGR03746 family)